MAIMKTLADRARDNLKIFKTQNSGTDSTHKVQSQDKLKEHMKYLMQEAGLLTSREADVARLICDGLIDKEITERLGLSRQTVKDYLKINICQIPGPRPRPTSLVNVLIGSVLPKVYFP